MPEILDADGAVIGSILVQPGSIFDLDNPSENNVLYRMANKVHVTTRQEVIAQQLLFVEGDTFSRQILDESERVLRANRFIKDASVELHARDNCVIDVSVKTTDTWTLSPKLSFSRSGGQNSSDIGVKEMNLLGTGIYVEALYSTNVDRQSKQLKIIDRNLGNSWYGLRFLYDNSSDGHTADIELGKPFYALGSTNAHYISFFDNDRIDSYYDLGSVVGTYRHQSKAYEIARGWSTGLVDDWVRRWSAGIAYNDHQFLAAESTGVPGTVLPTDRQLFYPFVGVEWLQNKFDKTQNYDQIGRTEDRYLGTRFSARLGRSATQLGSDRDAWLLSLQAQSSFGDSKSTTITVDGSLTTRVESGKPQDLALDSSVTYHRRQSEKWLFVAGASVFYGYELDADHIMDLGGDTGLRGYPLRYQSGDKKALFSMEQRFFSNWYPLRLFHVGAAAFVDVGRTWGQRSVTTTNLGWLKDVGVGLRLGSDRSGLGNVIHIDLALPLDGTAEIDSLQLVISTKKSF
ncbi:MAG: hypothetical protein OEW64_03320 [Gammaproteobacteria bacterium]|nr:hypothetical protein [Gammaproteobacteria bacterium]MDH5323149.1 hypothetical protein [Gammaproteobacteria bacterium]